MIAAIKRYVQESFQELHMVTWPTRKAALRITIIVLVFTAVSALALGALDQILTVIYQRFI